MLSLERESPTISDLNPYMLLSLSEFRRIKNKTYVFDIDGTLTNPDTYLKEGGYAFKVLKPFVFDLISFLHKEENITLITSGLSGLPISNTITDMINARRKRCKACEPIIQKEEAHNHPVIDLIVNFINLETYQDKQPQSRVDFLIEFSEKNPDKTVLFFGDSLQDLKDLIDLSQRNYQKNRIFYMPIEDSFFADFIYNKMLDRIRHQTELPFFFSPKELLMELTQDLVV